MDDKMLFKSKGTSEKRHRLIILTDMENEPDDSQTMVKLLMYSNELDIEGLIAVTSRWLPKLVFPESITDRVTAYGIVRKNLIKHATGWPTEEYLHSRVAGGQRGYGMAAVGDGKATEGSELIIRAADIDDPRPIWVAINAGANTLAQALWDVRRTRTPEQTAQFVQKIKVYDDSGQDDAGAWIAHEFPDLFYIRSRSQVFGLFGPKENTGPQPWEPLDQYDWAELNVRTRHGVLGVLYPQRVAKDGHFYFMDGGGTTTWLGLVNKGLFEPDQISWGGWGGRFSWNKEQVPAGQFEVDQQESPYFPYLMYPQAKDDSFEWKDDGQLEEFSKMIGETENAWKIFAPLWRWRNAYTRDFKARMDWCVSDYLHANHHPVINFYGDENRSIIFLSVEPGERVRLDASASWDPDDKIRYHTEWGFPEPPERLSFNWYCYPEAGTYAGVVTIESSRESICHVNVPSDAGGKQIHIILEVTDSDSDAPLTSYRRIVMNVE